MRKTFHGGLISPTIDHQGTLTSQSDPKKEKYPTAHTSSPSEYIFTDSVGDREREKGRNDVN
ncbi:Uncharacterized protein APZ42_031726 [Daphnia magna]|uniref:Uncharacterized protein n=1 Tax=Daphnia magna TaxID=35525 RepID=A0A164MKW6_9CRUS|nr:Uncharacterized protein APZ42_031726 [Daphnia magna]